MGTIRDGALKVMVECMAVKPGEKVLVVTDPLIDFSVAKALYDAAKEVGGLPTIFYTEPPKSPGANPSDLVVDVMKKVDVIVTPTSTTLYHCPAMKEARKCGARVGAMTDVDADLLSGKALSVDFNLVKPVIDKVGAYFEKGKKLRFTTPAGTDITASIEGRPVNNNDAMVHGKGEGQGVPDLEVYIAPVEGTGNGKLVIDASCSGGIGLIKEPMVITIKDGFAVSIEGGKEAEFLRNSLEATNNPNAYNLAEMAIGMNPCAQVRGMIIEDESTLGTCHCALGTNANFGGHTLAPVHIDMVQWKPTVYVDDEIIMKDGELLI